MKNKNRIAVLGTSAVLSLTILGSAFGVASAQTATPSTTATATATLKVKGQPGGRGFGAHAATIAKVLGITAAELQTELGAGKTVAHIATAKGISLQLVIDAYVAEEMVEHPEMAKADVVTKVTNQLNGIGPVRAGGTKLRGTKPAGTRGSNSSNATATVATATA
jgi:hypothetical protein